MEELAKQLQKMLRDNREKLKPNQGDLYGSGYSRGYLDALRGVLWLVVQMEEEERKNTDLVQI